MTQHVNADICTWPDGPEACAEDLKGCFPCRLRYWSKVGLGATYAGGRDEWHNGQTIREAREEIFENAKRYGNEPPEPYNGYASATPIVRVS